MEPTDTLEALVAQIVAEYCRQEQLPEDREQELYQLCLDRLVQKDGALLRDFSGERVNLESYLSALLPPILMEAESDRGKQLLLDHLDVIQSRCKGFARQKMDPTEAEEFPSQVIERLCEHDYRLLRRFRGRSFRAYISRVNRSVFVDRVVRRKKGRFRASEEAKRLGLEAEHLEELIYWQGCEVREAVERTLQETWSWKSREELFDLAHQLPVRENPTEVPLTEHHQDQLSTDPVESVDETEAKEERMSFIQSFGRAIRSLSAEEQVLLRMIFQDGLSIAECSRILRTEQRPLYRVRDRALGKVRQFLKNEGFDWKRVRDLLLPEAPDLDWGSEDEDDEDEAGSGSEGSSEPTEDQNEDEEAAE